MLRATLVSLILLTSTTSGCADSYSAHEQFAAFADRMVAEHGFDRAELIGLFAQAHRKDAILEAIARPAERVLTWGEYRKIFLNEQRISGGVEFWRDNRATLQRAADQFGVAPEVVVAIIGVETRYGGNMGSYRVIDALSTLGFDYPPRSKFFLGELEQFLLLAREQGFDPLKLKGSYAGAMGMGQFIPSSYRAYAVDFDADHQADIWNNPVDAIGSVSNYFNRHGWRRGAQVAEPVKAIAAVDEAVVNNSLTPTLGRAALTAAGLTAPSSLAEGELVTALKLETDGIAEYWVGYHNFYVITRYNRSHMYAMAVFQLSEAIRTQMADRDR